MTPEDKMRKVFERATDAAPAGPGWESFRRTAHRRLLMNRALIGGVGLLLIVGGVAAGATFFPADEGAERPLQPAASTEPAPTPTPSEEPTSAPSGDVPVELWFTQEELLFREVAPVVDEGLTTDDTHLAFQSVKALLAGGGPWETAIPEGTEVNELYVDESGTATIDLTSEFGSGGGSLSMRMRVAQVAFTLTQFEDIEGVLFAIDGEKVSAIGGEGVGVEEPVTRADFEDLAPPIVVESPRPGEEVSSPVVISGDANVFEANVNIRILDAQGEVLAETFVTATCGSGCRGTYEKQVRFRVDHEQQGTIEVLTYSAEDGSPQFVVETPVTLMP